VGKTQHIHFSVVLSLVHLPHQRVVSLGVKLLWIDVSDILEVHIKLWLVGENTLGKFIFSKPEGVLF